MSTIFFRSSVDKNIFWLSCAGFPPSSAYTARFPPESIPVLPFNYDPSRHQDTVPWMVESGGESESRLAELGGRDREAEDVLLIAIHESGSPHGFFQLLNDRP
jgi:hypothetical protein